MILEIACFEVRLGVNKHILHQANTVCILTGLPCLDWCCSNQQSSCAGKATQSATVPAASNTHAHGSPSRGVREALNSIWGTSCGCAAEPGVGDSTLPCGCPAWGAAAVTASTSPMTYTSICCRDLRNSSACGSTLASDCSRASACCAVVGCALMSLVAAVQLLRSGNRKSVPGKEPCVQWAGGSSGRTVAEAVREAVAVAH